MFRLSTAKKKGWIAVEIVPALLLAYRFDGNAASGGAAARTFPVHRGGGGASGSSKR